MKCQSKVVWQTRKRKGNGKPYQFAKASYHPEIGIPIPDDAELCDGEIKAEVELDYDYYGGCACCSGPPDIKLRFTCTKCGQTYHPGLPQDRYQLTDFLNNVIAKL